MNQDVARSATTTLVALATIASLRAITSVVEGGPWVGTTSWLVVVAAVVVATSRALVSQRSLENADHLSAAPSFIGSVAATWLILGVFGSTDRRFSPVVGLSNIEQVREQLDAAGTTISAEIAPVLPSTPIELLIAVGALAVFLVADLICVGLRLPAMTTLPLLALWIPALVIDGNIPLGAVAFTIAPLIAILAIAPARTGRESQARIVDSGSVVTTTAVVTVCALAAGTLVSGLAPVVSRSWSDAFASQGSAVRLSDDLDMRRNLDEQSDQVVLTYSGDDARNIGPLRVYTASAFDGTQWLRSDSASGDLISDQDLLWPEGQSALDDPSNFTVRLDGYRDSLLPITLGPRRVAAGGEWRYSAAQDELRSPSVAREGMEYTISSESRDLTPEALRAANGVGDVGDRYLEVPESPHVQDIAGLADSVAGDSGSPYDAAVALQTWFRSSKNFTYTTDIANPVTGDPVWDFLQDRNGYCVQFATSMTVMARSLGIPARLGVGFLPGDRRRGNQYEVTGEKSHAWPELYFPGTGWVRFEPTPATQTGAVPRYADPLLDSSPPTPMTAPAPGEEAPDSAARDTDSDLSAQQSPAKSSTATHESWWTGERLALGGLGAIVLGFLILLRLARRHTDTSPTPTYDAAWDALRRNLELRGFVWSPSLTPQALPAAVREYVTTLGVSCEYARNLETQIADISGAIEADRYAPPARRSPLENSIHNASNRREADLMNQVNDVARSIDREISGLRRAADPIGPRAD